MVAVSASVTTCWASTSSAPRIGRRDSMRRCSSASRAAANSPSSSALAGTQRISLTAPGWWPLRPARWISRAMPFGPPICSTCSTGEKSTPRSSELVATTARRVPSRRPCSASARSVASSEPWCRPMASSGAAIDSASCQRSACERVLVNTSELFAACSASTTLGSIASPMWPPQGKRSTVSGIKVRRRRVLGRSPPMRRPGFPDPSASCGREWPSRQFIASTTLPSVADTPHTLKPGESARKRESASSVCTPRLLPISSCHSSTITALSPRHCGMRSA